MSAYIGPVRAGRVGRPYAEEMSELARTYAWARGVPVGGLAGFCRQALGGPMYAVGSGGSFTAATFASALHEQGGNMSKAVTPLEFVWQDGPAKTASVLLLTAGGGNKDVLAAFAKAAPYGPQAGIVCTSTESELVRRASGGALVHAARPPSGRDGFLATNSLLATMVWLARAYAEALSLPGPPPFERLARPDPGALEGARGARTLMVLHDCWGRTAAVDAESKMSEACLAGVQAADYRGFAHGRHNWLDKDGHTCVVAMITPGAARLRTGPWA